MDGQPGDELDALLARIDAGELGDPLPVLAYLAGRAVSVDDGELNGARRRAVLLVAAGGDPHRGLEIDDRAVKALATDLYDADRRAQLARGLDALVLRVRDLPVAREAAIFLVTDVDLAWRMFALAPAKWTRRLASSTKNSTYNRCSETVSTVEIARR